MQYHPNGPNRWLRKYRIRNRVLKYAQIPATSADAAVICSIARASGLNNVGTFNIAAKPITGVASMNENRLACS